jgi:hypothetical protein
MIFVRVKKSPAFYGTRRYITAFTRALGIHIEPDESSVYTPCFSKARFNIILPSEPSMTSSYSFTEIGYALQWHQYKTGSLSKRRINFMQNLYQSRSLFHVNKQVA